LAGDNFVVTREDIVAEIERVPEERLDELYVMLKKYEKNGEQAVDVNVMANLRAIKISATPDLSARADLYELEKHDDE
jgi:hypothetical protein